MQVPGFINQQLQLYNIYKSSVSDLKNMSLDVIFCVGCYNPPPMDIKELNLYYLKGCEMGLLVCFRLNLVMVNTILKDEKFHKMAFGGSLKLVACASIIATAFPQLQSSLFII